MLTHHLWSGGFAESIKLISLQPHVEHVAISGSFFLPSHTFHLPSIDSTHSMDTFSRGSEANIAIMEEIADHIQKLFLSHLYNTSPPAPPRDMTIPYAIECTHLARQLAVAYTHVCESMLIG